MTQIRYHSGAFPPRHIDWASLVPQIGPASAAVARFDGTLAAIPNAAVLLSPLITQEAVLSSRIEGTQATMGEVLEFEAGSPPDGLSDGRLENIQEVLNYRRAMRQAQQLLETMPICLRVVLDLHRTLLHGVRGQGKAPGELRRVPNWIGAVGRPEAEARYVPISAGELPQAMSAWEKYVNGDGVDRLTQLAIIHAEFEALHPFLDGNGRLGRMLVPLFLWKSGLIRKPLFYVSAYLEAHRDLYYERLLGVSRDGDWTSWCSFFLGAVQAQAADNQAKAEAILGLYNDLKRNVVDWTHSQYAVHALDWVFATPIFRSSDFVASAKIPAPTAKRILAVLRDVGMLRVISVGRGRRASTLVFPSLLNIAEGRDAF